MATFNVTGAGATATYDAPSDTLTLNVPGGAGVAGSLAPADFNLGSITGTQTVNHASNLYTSVLRLTLSGNAIANFTNVPALASGIIIIQQGASPFTFDVQQDGATTTRKWGGGTVPTWSSTAGAIDIVAWQKSGTNIYLSLADKGYA